MSFHVLQFRQLHPEQSIHLYSSSRFSVDLTGLMTDPFSFEVGESLHRMLRERLPTLTEEVDVWSIGLHQEQHNVMYACINPVTYPGHTCIVHDSIMYPRHL